MATYEEIYGKRVKEFDSDPTLENSYEGQVWYDKSTGVLKSVVSFGAWLSASNMGTGRILGAGGGSTVNASLMCGGLTPSSTANSEEYNGFVWTEGNNIPTSTDGAAFFGTQTAAIAASGRQPPANTGTQVSYSYDGTSWTSTPNTGTASRNDAGAGTQTAGLIFGGYTPGVQNKTVEWNGSSWTNGNNMNNPREGHAGAGISQTDALSMGGNPNPPSTLVEAYDGTNWTSVADLPVGRPGARGATGPGSAALISGSPNIVNLWNGSSWSTLPGTLASARSSNQMSGVGQTNALLYGGGAAPPYSSATEEYNFGINTVTAAAWASGGTLPITMRQNMSFGTQTAAINCGGYAPPGTKNDSLSYDGTSWTATPNLNAAARFGGVAGTQSAGLQFAGIQPDTTLSANVQSWNGSTWSNNPYNVSTGTYGNMGCGTQTAALKIGGAAPGSPSIYATTEEYDGEGWTAGGTMPQGRYGGGGNGLQTTCVFAGGQDATGPSSTSCVEYDGSSWTAGGTLLNARGSGAMGAGASSDSALVFGGAPAQSFNEGYDGTAFSARPSLATGRGFSGGNGIATAALIVAGGPPSGTTTNVEEFTGETETITSQTLTTS
tara:strand:- start:3 stop:1823 length:1821 start_codon:yes stop_codon:yes gene_type:complete